MSPPIFKLAKACWVLLILWFSLISLFCLSAILARFFSNGDNVQGSQKLPGRTVLPWPATLLGSPPAVLEGDSGLITLSLPPQSTPKGSVEHPWWADQPTSNKYFVTISRHKGAAVSSTSARNFVVHTERFSLPKRGARSKQISSRKLFSLYERWPWTPVPKLST